MRINHKLLVVSLCLLFSSTVRAQVLISLIFGETLELPTKWNSD